MFLDTQKITHEIRMKHWMQIIAQRQQSGLTVKGFCAQQDIPIKQYYYWQHKLRIRFAPAQAPETKKEEVPTLFLFRRQFPSKIPSLCSVVRFPWKWEVTEHISERLLQKTLQLLQKVNA